ncbi:hypothetical protein MBLNU230_g4895t1 [Neophaeotheca triangularis]
MPSISDSRQRVASSLQQPIPPDVVDHDSILNSLEAEIEKHNEAKRRAEDDLQGRRKKKQARYEERESRRERHAQDYGDLLTHPRLPRSLRSKLETGERLSRGDKDDLSDLRRSDNVQAKFGPSATQSRPSGKRKRRKRSPSTPVSPEPGEPAAAAAHPFPREPEQDTAPSDREAFRTALFDALADEEQADYWQAAYGQPIHVYERPSVPKGPKGELEEMGDEEYAAFVREKMFEKQHPEVVWEREREGKRRKEKEEREKAEREAYVRKKRQERWKRDSGWKGGENDEERDDEDDAWDRYEHAFAGEVPMERERSGVDWTALWKTYQEMWDTLKERVKTGEPGDLQMPWPTRKILSANKKASNPDETVTHEDVQTFMRQMPLQGDESRPRILKSERARWHPDKMVRVLGALGEDSAKAVEEAAKTVYIAIDQLIDEEKAKG